MAEYELDKLYPHEHRWDYPTMMCELCGITAEEVAQGRDRPATWEDVDEAYLDGRRVGIEIGKMQFKLHRRLKLIEVGYYLCLRRLQRQAEDEAVRRAEEREK